MEIDGGKSKSQSSRSLRARNTSSSDGRSPEHPRKPNPNSKGKARTANGHQHIATAASASEPLRSSHTASLNEIFSKSASSSAAAPQFGKKDVHRNEADISSRPATDSIALNSSYTDAPDSDSSTSSRDSAANEWIRRTPPPSAPDTPATTLSVSTNQSSSVHSTGRKASVALELSNPASLLGNDQAVATPSRAPSGSRKGKAKATNPVAAAATSASASSSRRLRSSSNPSRTGSNGTSAKKRTAGTDALDNSPRSGCPKRRRQGESGTIAYNLRSKATSSQGSPAAKASTMGPRKGSGDFSLTRASGGSHANGGAGPASVKGKSKAKGGRGARSKGFSRDHAEDFDCSEDGLEHGYDRVESSEARDEPLPVEDEDVAMEDADAREKAPSSAVEQGTSLEDKSEDPEGEPKAGEADPSGAEEDGDDAYGTLEGDDDGEDHFENEEDDDEDDPYGDARDDGGAGAFGLNLRAMAGYMSGLTSRFRSLLASLKDSSDPTAQLVSLQELSELLSVSTEDTLAGYFPTDAFVKELIYIMGGPKPADSRSAAGSGGDRAQHGGYDDEDEEMAAAIAAAAAADFEEDSGEKMLLACRCLANLIEAMPYTAHSAVTHGAIPVLTSKLMEITFIDLAEQVLQTLEKISQDFPGYIVKEGGLMAILQYLDFFNIHVQRTAMTAAGNCCRKLSVESFSKVKDVMPTIQNVLSYSDQRLVESACRCVVRMVESFKHRPDLLEQLLSTDLLSAVNTLLLPASAGTKAASTTSLGSNVYTDVLKALGTASRASPEVAVSLLENNIVETLYHLLTGSPAPAEGQTKSGDQGVASASAASPKVRAMELEANDVHAGSAEMAAVAIVPEAQGTVTVADMAVLQNLAQRPKEQIQEALSLVGELLPPLPKDGVFDTRAYSEKAYLRRKSADSRSRRKNSSSGSNADADAEPFARESTSEGNADLAARKDTSPSRSTGSTPSKSERQKSEREVAKEAAQAKRVATLNARGELVQRFTQLVLPTLVEVYAASVASHVRSKAITGILKILSFVEPEPLSRALDNVPLAGFVASILSTRDHPYLVHGALQIVELLTIKLPDIYTALLRREGVMWEIENLASQEPITKRSLKKLGDVSSGSTKVDGQVRALALPGGTSSTHVSGGSNAVEQAKGTSGLARLLGAASSTETSGGDTGPSVGSSLGSGPSSASRGQLGAQSLAEASDANVWRARVLRSKFSAQAVSSEGAHKALQALEDIKSMVQRLSDEADNDEMVARETLDDISALFLKRENPISSFELLRSGLVEGLYSFATESSGSVALERRRSIVIQSLLKSDEFGNSAASLLVRRLQESLSRLENVEITTALSGGSDESQRSSSSMLGRQLRLRLVAEDGETDIPRTCTNIVVTIHAVATFQSLNDYLRPKIASAAAAANSGAAVNSGASRLSSVLAAFAAATSSGAFPGLSDQSPASGSRAEVSSAVSQRGVPAEASRSEKDDPKGKSPDGSNKKAQPRRSSRLSGGSSSEAVATGQNPNTAKQPDAQNERAKDESHKVEKRRADEERSRDKADEGSLSGDDDGHAAADDRKAGAEARAIAERLFGESAEGESDEALARRLMGGLLHDGLDEDEEFSDEEFDEEILQSEITADAPTGLGGDSSDVGDKTINLDVDKDAGQVVAKTSDGTQIAASQNESGASKGPEASASLSPSKPSYASALQKMPSDWHLEFSLGEQPLSLDTTIYGAVHRFEMSPERAGADQHAHNKYIWGNVYTVKYKKVSGPALKPEPEGTPEPRHASSVAVELPDSVKADAPHAKLLQLLAVLHDLNAEWRESHRSGGELGACLSARLSPALKEAAFVNNKLTAKLNRQLEEPMIVASACLPDWSLDLPRVFPFLFPFEARFSFLQSTAFGYARLLTRWQSLHSRNQDHTSSSFRIDDSFGFLGRLQRQKVRISRSSLLASAFKVLELYGSTSSVLEVEYFEEVGTGLGPTLEFYSLVSKEFARKDLELWRDDDAAGTSSDYVSSPGGLFPAPFDPSDVDSADSKKRIHAFKILGQFVAKALLDSRIIDCNFSSVFMRAVLNQPLPADLNTLGAVDPTLAKALRSMQQMGPDEVGGLALDFSVPGYSKLELHPGGSDEAVDASNLDRYISEVLSVSLDSGIRPAVRAFRQGFNLIFPIAAMSSFTADELVMLFGNTDEDWSEPTLMRSIKPDHGLNAESASFKDIIAIMSSFSVEERRDFLQWLTGSPKLPIGGFAGLHPQLTVVKRPHEAPLTPDDYLPSVMTCVNYLKMPLYSSRERMRQRLEIAMKEGSTSFHLS